MSAACALPAATEPRLRLGWRQLALRLAAGHTLERVAERFGRSLDEVARKARAPAVRRLAHSLKTLVILPAEALVTRLASRAARYLADAQERDVPGAARYAELCRGRGQD